VHKFLIVYFCLSLVSGLSWAQEAPHELNDVEDLGPSDRKVVPPAAKTQQPPQQTLPPDVQSTPYNPRIESNQSAPDQKGSSGSGDVIFDWSKHKGETEVAHPFAEKGLIRISKDGTYYYKVDESTSHQAMSLQVGMFNPMNLKNPDAPSNVNTFADNYDQTSNPAFLFTKEWQMWTGALGKVSFQLGSGAFIAQGHGHFAGQYDQALTPMEVFTFVAMPNNVGVVYRLQFTHRPLFLPFIDGGGTAFTFAELRDDTRGPKFGGALAAYAGAGVGLNLTYFDYMSRIQLDHEYGITAVYLTAEYRRYQGFTRYDFTSDYINGGFLLEY